MTLLEERNKLAAFAREVLTGTPGAYWVHGLAREMGIQADPLCERAAEPPRGQAAAIAREADARVRSAQELAAQIRGLKKEPAEGAFAWLVINNTAEEAARLVESWVPPMDIVPGARAAYEAAKGAPRQLTEGANE